MIQKLQLSLLLILLHSFSFAQLNTTLLGEFPYSESLSDVWHYATAEHEYALVGVNNAFSIVDVTTPANAFEVANIPGPSTIWRDIKTYENYAYVTNESAEGLLIVDMSGLPAGVTATNFYGNNGVTFSTAHNLFIDVDAGYCYIFGADYSAGGAIILDLNNNPANPEVVGVYDDTYVHDGTVYNNIFYSAEINNGRFRLIDVTDKSNLVVLGQQTTTTAFCHNIWPSEDGQYVFTTDEVSSAYIESYDVSDPSNILYLDRIQSNPGSGTIPHNAHWKDDYVVVSYYSDGLVIYDASNPSALVEVGNYDHSSFSGNGFNGSWGANPYLPSGNILSTDIEEGLFIIGFNNAQATFIEGTVTDAITGATIDDVQVEILLNPVINTSSDGMGAYSSGFATGGLATIVYNKFGYQQHIEANVDIINGATTVVDVQLDPLESFTASGQVLDSDGFGISGAQVVVSNTANSFNFQTDQEGTFTITDFYEGTYNIIVGQWGYLTTSLANINVNPSSSSITVELEKGYCDDFSFDFGWTSSGNATTGYWELGEPNGTSFNGTESNPDNDVTSDLGDLCFVTGNAGGGGGTDDIDDGAVILTSPIMDLSSYNEPEISFNAWFFNDGGQGGPNDYFDISLSNGATTYLLESFTTNTPGWQLSTLNIDTSIVELTSEMNLVLTSADDDPGHIVEAAFDAFKLIDLNPDTTNIESSILQIEDSSISLAYENPMSHNLQISYSIKSFSAEQVLLKVTDINGRIIERHLLKDSNGTIVLSDETIPSGLYFIHLYMNGIESNSKKLIKL